MNKIAIKVQTEDERLFVFNSSYFNRLRGGNSDTILGIVNADDENLTKWYMNKEFTFIGFDQYLEKYNINEEWEWFLQVGRMAYLNEKAKMTLLPLTNGLNNANACLNNTAKYFINFNNSLTSFLANQQIKQREQQIIDSLQKSGFSVSEIGNLEEFLKTRCHIVKSEDDKRCSLFADNKLVATWYDTVDIQTTTNEKGEITVTAIMGNPPK